MEVHMFSILTQEKIKYYVYCLRDPETKEVFYVGKGKGNRVFSHANGDMENDSNAEKIELIKSIREKGLEVEHWILRYGLEEKEAFEVESALIDYIGLENLSNRVKGHSSNRGKISCKELDILLGARKIVVLDNVMAIKITAKYRADISDHELYEATNKWWRANKERAEKVDYVLSVHNGIVRGVFKPTAWYKSDDGKRIGFDGVVAEESIKERYLNRLLEENGLKGKANPIRYFLIDEMNHQVIEEQEDAEPDNDDVIEITEKVIMIKINASYREGMKKEEIYRATQGSWKLSLDKAKNAEYVISVVNGIVIEVFKPLCWKKSDETERISFDGELAPNEIRDKYLSKSVKHLYNRGEANPCKYFNF